MKTAVSFVKNLLVSSMLICGLVLTSCGSDGSSNSKLKKNEYLGNLPALYDSYSIEKDKLDKKLEKESNKLIAGGEKNYNKIQKLFDEKKAKEKELKEKFQTNVKAEVAKIVGKEVPVSFSEKLKNSDKLYYNVSNIKIIDDKGEAKVTFLITAKDDFTIPSMKAYDYSIYYCLIGSNGVLEKSTSVIMYTSLAREEKSFEKDDVLIQFSVGFNLGNYAANRATFSGIEFISEEEYKTAMGL